MLWLLFTVTGPFGPTPPAAGAPGVVGGSYVAPGLVRSGPTGSIFITSFMTPDPLPPKTSANRLNGAAAAGPPPPCTLPNMLPKNFSSAAPDFTTGHVVGSEKPCGIFSLRNPPKM